MSHFGKRGLRSQRASVDCMACIERETPCAPTCCVSVSAITGVRNPQQAFFWGEYLT